MPRHQGVTLLELLVCIAIMAILIGLGGPAMQTFIERQRVNITAQQIHRQMTSARIHAVTSGQRVVFCGADTEFNCVRDNIQQFIVFEDRNRNFRYDPDDHLYSTWDTPTGSSLRVRPSLALGYITFNPDGSARQTGSVLICPESQNPRHIRRVTVHRMGRVYNALPKPEDGIVRRNAASNTHINCET